MGSYIEPPLTMYERQYNNANAPEWRYTSNWRVPAEALTGNGPMLQAYRPVANDPLCQLRRPQPFGDRRLSLATSNSFNDLSYQLPTNHPTPTPFQFANLSPLAHPTSGLPRKRKPASDAEDRAWEVPRPFDQNFNVMSGARQPYPLTFRMPYGSYVNPFVQQVASLPANPILSLSQLNLMSSQQQRNATTRTIDPRNLQSLSMPAAVPLPVPKSPEFWRRTSKRVRYIPEGPRSEVIHQQFVYEPTRRLQNLIGADGKHMPNPKYGIVVQNWKVMMGVRKELIQWMYKINRLHGFSYHPDTLYRAINYLDRFLSRDKVRWRLRVAEIALACFYIASKFGEESREPQVRDMIDCAQNSITPEKVRKLEREVLLTLEWEIHVVTPHAITYELLNSLPGSASVRRVHKALVDRAQRFLDVACLDWDYLRHTPAVLAVASLCCAMESLNFADTRESRRVLELLTSVSEAAVTDCVKLMKSAANASTNDE
ncbi:hypothetical protein BC936DRAFT_144840 [Jimgerdemannia flammicorona]|uniref:Uncharacterized protein n=2 Tax=Jimgerdemannia flammicorona TaxID=994334 RepID=A0A433DBJ2_9FUNG|nr:hypothetical protein BC936DRAFT_144840 [Jimgerdemannia flammicorona]RUS33547.1 hypothetical protein BC938DRAFT_471129 [Jimgerdemannia flammicorona]